jgi:hypothetical protein
MTTISGGKVLEAKLRELAHLISRPATLRVGFLENAKYPDGTSVAMVAALNDFGTHNSPPRPFFRDMVAEKKSEWPKAIAGLLATNGMDPIKTLEQTGTAIGGQLRESIVNAESRGYPPLKPSTIRRKGFAKLLVDTGHMLNSIDHEVRT